MNKAPGPNYPNMSGLIALVGEEEEVGMNEGRKSKYAALHHILHNIIIVVVVGREGGRVLLQGALHVGAIWPLPMAIAV